MVWQTRLGARMGYSCRYALYVLCRIETSGSLGRFRTRVSSLVRPQSSSEVLIYLPREIAVQLTTTELRKLREPRPSGSATSWESRESEPYKRFEDNN